MNAVSTESPPAIGDCTLYDHFMEIARNRITTRQFDPDYEVPKEHYEMILEAARHAPSGANAQPWHFIIVQNPAVKQEIANYFVEEQRFRASLKMKFPTPNYAGIAGAPG
jgi:nitroreductase